MTDEPKKPEDVQPESSVPQTNAPKELTLPDTPEKQPEVKPAPLLPPLRPTIPSPVTGNLLPSTPTPPTQIATPDVKAWSEAGAKAALPPQPAAPSPPAGLPTGSSPKSPPPPSLEPSSSAPSRPSATPTPPAPQPTHTTGDHGKPFTGEFNLPDAAAPPPGSAPPKAPNPKQFRWDNDPTTGRRMVRSEQDWQGIQQRAREYFASQAAQPQESQSGQGQSPIAMGRPAATPASQSTVSPINLDAPGIKSGGKGNEETVALLRQMVQLMTKMQKSTEESAESLKKMQDSSGATWT